MQNILQAVNRQALVRSIAVGLSLMLVANIAIYSLYWVIRDGQITPFILSIPLILNGFMLFLYLACGASYVSFSKTDSWQEGAAGGGLTGLVTTSANIALSLIIMIVLFGAGIDDALQQGLTNAALPSIGVFNATQSAMILIGGGTIGVTLLSVFLSAFSGALYATSHERS